MRINILTDEFNTYHLLALLTAFFLLTYNPTLAVVYYILSTISYSLYKNGSFKSFPFLREKTEWPMAVLQGVIAYFIFIYGMPYILGLMGYTQFSTTMSVIKLVAATNPVLAGSSFLALIAFGVLVPRIETVLASRLLEWWGHMLNISLSKITFGLVMLIIWISGLWVFLHTQAKGVTDNPALIAVFVFFAFSLALILIFKATIQAVVMHTVSNSLAIYYSMSVVTAFSIPIFGLNPLLVYGALILAIWKFKLYKIVGASP